MASVSTYLNFMGNTEEAFNFYKKVFRSEFSGQMMRMGDVPAEPGTPALSDEDKNKIMHVALPTLGGHLLMGTDMLESMGHKLVLGNNININLEPDSKEEADRLFNELSEGGKVEMPMQVMFWGDYFGSFIDKYGVQWMINFATKK